MQDLQNIEIDAYIKMSQQKHFSFYLATCSKDPYVPIMSLRRRNKENMSSVQLYFRMKHKTYDVNLHHIVAVGPVWEILDLPTWKEIRVPNAVIGLENNVRRWIYASKGPNDYPLTPNVHYNPHELGVIGHYGHANLRNSLYSTDAMQLIDFRNRIAQPYVIIAKVSHSIEQSYGSIDNQERLMIWS